MLWSENTKGLLGDGVLGHHWFTYRGSSYEEVGILKQRNANRAVEEQPLHYLLRRVVRVDGWGPVLESDEV